MLIQADEWVQAADEARGRREALQRQIDSAEGDLNPLRQMAKNASDRFESWTRDWSRALTEAGFPVEHDPDTVEAALNVVGRIDEALIAIRDIRTQRIETMRADLDSFEAMACDLSERVAPDLLNKGATDIAVELKRRLEAAREIQAEAKRQQASVNTANQAIEGADADALRAQATLEPLMLRSGAATKEELRKAIQRSDERAAMDKGRQRDLAFLMSRFDRQADSVCVL